MGDLTPVNAERMETVGSLIRRRGGLVATHELYADGFTRAEIADAVRSRRVLRVRQGWYARPDTDRTVLRAARVGGRVTCVTALGLQGVWIPRQRDLHVACAAHDARLRRPSDSRQRIAPEDPVTVHWRTLPPGGSRLILEPLDALVDAIRCLDHAVLPLAADSLLHTHPGVRTHWRAFLASRPRRVRELLDAADGVCESGIETKTWLGIRSLSIPVRRQVSIARVGRVDFVIGARLVVEVDGQEYHTDPQQFEDDRRRDAALASLGFVTLRFSYAQVMDRWPDVSAAIAGALARGSHLDR